MKKTLFLIIVLFPFAASGQNLEKPDTLLTYQPEIKVIEVKANSNFALSALYTTNYIWRDAVGNYSALQPSASYTFGKTGFSLNFWSSFGTRYNTNDLEISVTLSYTFLVTKQLNLSLGVIHYPTSVLASDNNTVFFAKNFSEFFFAISTPGFLQANLYTYITNKGVIYSNIAVAKTLPVGKKYNLDLNASLGHRIQGFHRHNGFRDANFTVSAPVNTPYVDLGLFASVTYVVRRETTHYQAGINFVFK